MALIIFILILAALIVVHELGHLTAAKLFGIKVEEFGVGFPPRLLSVQWGETRYSINLLFFGGYVRIFGERKEEAAGNSRAFASKPRPVQAAVIAAGIVMNLVFAWLLLAGGYLVGLPTPVEHVGLGQVEDAKVTIVGVFPDSPAERVGLKQGDIVERIETSSSAMLQDGTLTQEALAFITEHSEESMVFTVLRGAETHNFLVKPESGFIPDRKAVGIVLDDIGVLRLPPHLALLQGGIYAYHITKATAVGLSQFFVGLLRGAGSFTDIAGPIGIAVIGSDAVSGGFASAISFTAIISISLALLNLLPIPGLDGGRLFFILVEAVTRRQVSERLVMGLTIGGFALLIGLMVLVSFHDITRLIG